MADDETKTTTEITLNSPDKVGRKTIGVNGVTVDIPFNKRVAVTDAELEVLRNSDLGVLTMTEHEDTTGDTADVVATREDGMKAGTEASSIQAPATPADTSADTNLLAEGRGGEHPDQRRGGDAEIGGAPAGDIKGDGGQEGDKPTGDGGEAKGDDSDKDSKSESGEQSDDAKFLDRSIEKIDGDLAGIDDAGRLDALIAAEGKRQDPRSTLLTKLKARKAQLG